MKDPYEESSIADYKYSPDGNWTETIIAKDVDYMVATTSDSGEVYLLFYRRSDDSIILYKNGEFDSIIDTGTGGNIKLDLYAAGGHVYTVVNEASNGKTTERCDGKVTQSLVLSNDDMQSGSRNHYLYVTAGGDAYLATWYSVYKNDKLLYHSEKETINSFCVIE
jgi:hypothetical protein